ncbi:MAG: lantibiotic dehydratase [Acidobacteriota bacterium]
MSRDKDKSKTASEFPFAPSGFFAFRTPLYPYEELEAWGAGLASPGTSAEAEEEFAAAWAADRALLRERLRALLERPEVRESVFLASPSLSDGLDLWKKEPDGKKGQRAERALVRYVLRMCARPTPFGLFSGCSVGRLVGVDEPTRLRLAPRARYDRHTRLDMDYLFALVEELIKDPTVRAALSYLPNSSLYDAAGRMRYAEARLDGKVRSHHLVAVTPTSYLEETLARAKGGARIEDLAQALVDSDPDGEITREDADEYLTELVQSQLLVPDFGLPVTGQESIHDLLDQLAALPDLAIGHKVRERLLATRDAIAAIDAAGVGSDPERYREIERSLEELPTPVELSRLFQVDMVKPVAEAALGAAVTAELTRGVEVLHKMFGRSRLESLDNFRRDFGERYGEGRWVPLLEVLDEEVGIGYEKSRSAGAEASPLLAGVALGGPAAAQTVPWGNFQAVMMSKLETALASGITEIEISDSDVEKLKVTDAAPLPDSFQVMATLSAASEEDLDAGRFEVLWRGAGGPSGARLLGRFCHADAELTRLTLDHLRAEEAHQPGAIFAEVVHLPQGRIGNILARPVLREYEIPFLGRSGAPADKQIAVSDLDVTVTGNRIVIRSRSLRREVIPRLSSAHNFAMGSLGLYRFLCTLQSQNVAAGLYWGWGQFDGAAFLPRVRLGRTILSRATWRMTEEEIETLKKAKGAGLLAAARAWRERRKIPRLATLADGDNELLVDFENPLELDTFFDLIEERKQAVLHELFPGPDKLCVTGPEGRFFHEIVVPYDRKPAGAAAVPATADNAKGESDGAATLPAAQPPKSTATTQSILRRSFPPGSEWLYLKVYTGNSTADGIMRDAIGPAIREALSVGDVDSWFFIRYGDPEWHLRIRLHGDPHTLLLHALPRLEKAVSPLLADGRAWKIQLDTYERETERYGGALGMPICETLFGFDSDASLSIVETLEGDEGADARWRLAFRGADLILADLGIADERKITLMGAMRENFAKEFGGQKSLDVSIDQKYRTEKKSLAALLAPEPAEDDPLAPGYAILAERSRRSAPALAELARLEAAGELQRVDLAGSLIHMHLNRMIRSAARAHEAVIYGLLHREYQARAARARKGKVEVDGGKIGAGE